MTIVNIKDKSNLSQTFTSTAPFTGTSGPLFGACSAPFELHILFSLSLFSSRFPVETFSDQLQHPHVTHYMTHHVHQAGSNFVLQQVTHILIRPLREGGLFSFHCLVFLFSFFFSVLRFEKVFPQV